MEAKEGRPKSNIQYCCRFFFSVLTSITIIRWNLQCIHTNSTSNVTHDCWNRASEMNLEFSLFHLSWQFTCLIHDTIHMRSNVINIFWNSGDCCKIVNGAQSNEILWNPFVVIIFRNNQKSNGEDDGDIHYQLLLQRNHSPPFSFNQFVLNFASYSKSGWHIP